MVYHEHRGTIGKRFSDDYIQSVLKKNFLLFTWKNIHEWRRMWAHFFLRLGRRDAELALRRFAGADESIRDSRAPRWQLPRAVRSRSRAHALAAISDTEAFRRPLGGHFRDTFAAPHQDRLRVLFVSPYPICPPVHGGGVFMYQTVRELAKLCDLHLIVLLDWPHERKAHDELEAICASVEYVVRMEGRQKVFGSIEPHAVREFRNRRSRLADPSADLSPPHRRAAARVHGAGAVCRRIPAHPQHSVRARHLFPIHRAASSLHEEPDRKDPGSLGISAIAAL